MSICNGTFEHFAAEKPNSFLNDCSITLTDKKDSSDPTRREEYWRKVLKTFSSLRMKYFRLMVTSARFYTFFQGRSLVKVKCILLFKS